MSQSLHAPESAVPIVKPRLQAIRNSLKRLDITSKHKAGDESKSPGSARWSKTTPRGSPKARAEARLFAETSSAEFLQQLKAKATVHHIDLPPLTRDAIVELVSDRLKLSEPLPARTEQIIWERSVGHPLLACDLAWWLLTNNLIRVEQGHCIEEALLLAFRSDDMHLPSTVAAAATARLDRLTAQQQLILKIASLFDHRFEMSEWVRLCSASAAFSETSSALLDMLQLELMSLVHLQILVSDGNFVVFQQKHIRDAAYSLLTFKLRRRLHEELASMLKGKVSERQIAIHYIKAERWHEAFECLERCAEKAIRMHA